MGVLPLLLKENNSLESLGLKGSETFFISGIENMHPRKILQVKALKEDGSEVNFEGICLLLPQILLTFRNNKPPRN